VEKNETARSETQAGQKERDTFCKKFILENKGKMLVRKKTL
jgi:hypothetical protein